MSGAALGDRGPVGRAHGSLTAEAAAAGPTTTSKCLLMKKYRSQQEPELKIFKR